MGSGFLCRCMDMCRWVMARGDQCWVAAYRSPMLCTQWQHSTSLAGCPQQGRQHLQAVLQHTKVRMSGSLSSATKT